MMSKKWLLVLVMLVVVGGCTVATDPDTGQKTYALSEGAVKNIDATTSAIEAIGPPVAAGVSLISPMVGAGLSAVLTLLVTLFGTYKKWKQPLTAATTWQDKVTPGLLASAEGFEIVKDKAPEVWALIKPIFKRTENAGAINPDKV